MKTRKHSLTTLIGAGALLAGTAFAATPAAQATTPSSVCTTASVLGIGISSGTLTRWNDTTPTTAGDLTKTTVANTWSNMRLLASDHATGALYAIDDNGALHQYNYTNGAYTGRVQLGTGWGAATNLLPMGEGVLYATFTTGEMRAYNLTNGNIQGTIIGTGWNAMQAVASGGQGVVYGIDRNTGALHWWKRANYKSLNANDTFGTKMTIGNGWGDYTTLLGAGDGLLYGITTTGDMTWYNHTGSHTGTATWANGGTGTPIGYGWNTYRALTVNPNACSPSDAGGYSYIIPRDTPGVPRAQLAYGHWDGEAEMDIPTPINTVIYAVTSGTMNRTSNASSGKIGEVMGEDGALYRYRHLNSYIAADGARVVAGQPIAYSGNSGTPSGGGSYASHLHYEIHTNGVKRCPQTHLLAIFDGRTPPSASSLPTRNCGPLRSGFAADRHDLSFGESQ